MGQASVRRASGDDAPVVAALQLAIWQQSYPDLLPTSLLLADPGRLAAQWAARIDGGGPVLLAFEGAEPVGVAALGSAPDADGDGEIELLHVVPRWSRRGHGGRLLGESAGMLRSAGARRGYWWALEADAAIAGFLAGVSWHPDGGRRILDTGEGTLAEIRYSGGLLLLLV